MPTNIIIIIQSLWLGINYGDRSYGTAIASLITQVAAYQTEECLSAQGLCDRTRDSSVVMRSATAS